MSDGNLRYGAFVPQGWKLEYTGWTGPDAWAHSVRCAQLIEQLGYDHLWVYDHMETVPRREPTHVFEAFTMLAALAPQVPRVKLGQMVTCIGYRNVGVLAKEAACLDVISGGRLILGLGAGWYDEEYASYGWEFPEAKIRIATLDEACSVIKSLWTEERTTFHGKHLRFDGALSDPKPVQQLPPVWIGGGGEQLTLRVAAKHADFTNWQVGLADFVRKSNVLREHCDRIGRDFATITRTHAPDCCLFDTDDEARAWCETPTGGQLRKAISTDEYMRNSFVGSPESVAEKVQGFVDAGAKDFVLWFRDYPSTDSLERFMQEVVPLVKG